MQITLIIGPVGSGKKSIVRALYLANENEPQMMFASYAEETSLGGVPVLSCSRNRSMSASVLEYLASWRIHDHKSSKRHLIVVGRITDEDFRSLSAEFSNIRIIYIRAELLHSMNGVKRRLRDNFHNAPTIDLVHQHWRDHERHVPSTSILSALGNNRTLIINREQPFEKQIRDTVHFLKLDTKTETRLLRNFRNRNHPARIFLNAVSNRATVVEMPLVKVPPELAEPIPKVESSTAE